MNQLDRPDFLIQNNIESFKNNETPQKQSFEQYLEKDDKSTSIEELRNEKKDIKEKVNENVNEKDDDDEYEEEEEIESFGNMDENSNMNNKNNIKMVNSTFYITYAFLITTGTITFIEAIRTKDPSIRNILNLETCISIVAAFFYGKFVKMLSEDKVEYDQINYTRYLDWSITTPIMLLVLVLALLYNSKMGSMNFWHFVIILLLNYGMLGSGYLGEIKMLDKLPANIIGFVFFIALYFFIFYMYLRPSYNYDNYLLFLAFVILWAIYGVVYFSDQVTKNVTFNILDLLSKCFVGIFFWAYYTKVFTLD